MVVFLSRSDENLNWVLVVAFPNEALKMSTKNQKLKEQATECGCFWHYDVKISNERNN